MARPSRAEEDMYDAIIVAGVMVGLLPLAERLGIDYPWAHKVLSRLEERGLVIVERRSPGCPLVIKAARMEGE